MCMYVCVRLSAYHFSPDIMCVTCGTWCVNCQEKDIKTKVYTGPPCQGKCGFREQVIQGQNTQELFCEKS